MSLIASRSTVLMAAPLPSVVTLSMPAAPVLASTSVLAVAATAVPGDVGQGRAEAARAGTAAAAEPTPNANPVEATAPKPGEPTVSAPAEAGAPGATATTAVAATAPAPADASAAFTKPATTTHLGTPAAFPTRADTGSGIGGAVSALVVVIALILALAWLAKRMPVLGGGTGSHPALRIVASLALGPRERVVVVAVGDTQLLLGVGVGGTRTLHTLDAPLPVAAATTPAFAQLLAQHFGKKA